MPTENARNSYDLVPYESHAFPQTHPDRLATIATLLGMKPARSDGCRVLELGCASGGNLIPLAYALPESDFLGIDASRVQVAEGKETIRRLGLKNIDLRHQSIMDVKPLTHNPSPLGDEGSAEKYDFVICHGVYSWVPPLCQEKILEILKDSLNAHGVGYVSYNTYPGWHMRGLIRDMLYYHAKQFVEPAMRVKQARNLLDFLAKASTKDEGPYGRLLRQELEAFHRSSDSYLFHEHLEEHNEPIYFYQFAERAAAKGLRYLGETDLRVMVPGNYPPEIANVLHMLAQDNIHLEQYMDFLRNRMFRQTLLCHDSVQPNYGLRWQQLRGFYVASPASPSRDREGAVDPRDVPLPHGRGSEESMQFQTPDGVTLQARDAIVKAAMLVLGEAWPRALRFEELLEKARVRLVFQGADVGQDSVAVESSEHRRGTGTESYPTKQGIDEETLGQSLLTFYAQASTSLLELWQCPPKFATDISERPTASALARLQAETKNRVTTLRHESATLGEFERRLLCLLEGTRDRDALVRDLSALVHKGLLTVEKDGQPVRATELADVLCEAVERQLAVLAKSALLLT
ncbi:MAG: class I SAM-dependent methyltransferase [Gemmataceae bacterium]|nr:class I SAM-dependent methyltransferase [Gemmataceae bacterium]